MARWVGRHTWHATRWCAVTGAKRGGHVTARVSRAATGSVKTWSAQRATFGWSATVVRCGQCGESMNASQQASHGCVTDTEPARTTPFSGESMNASQQASHGCVTDTEPARTTPFSGESMRAAEPVKARATRLDTGVFTRRAEWANRPRVAEMSRKQFRAYARDLAARRRGPRQPSAPDGAGHHHTSTPNPGVVAVTNKEDTMHDPSNWAQGSEALAEPGITDTNELIEFLEHAATGAAKLVEHTGTFADLMRTAQVDDKIVDALNQAAEAAEAVRHHYADAHKRAADVYGDVTLPDFSKAA